MTAVVRGSTGETVILLPGDAGQEVSEATLTDLIKVATAVLSAAELQTISRDIPRLTISQMDSCLSVDGMALTVYRLTVD
ncbi:hypothetical protein ACWCRF_18930 [Streptomyces sp. NPDC002405]|uniref:hypothetical protein n=1 Tax=unclassified Streptomyces TaxID=2593676 RepID=UPI003689B19A